MHPSSQTRFLAALQALFGMLLLAGCASQSPELAVIGTPGTTLPGKVVLKAFELKGRGRIAVLKGFQGAAFGVLQSSHGDPEDRVPALNSWMWN